MSEQRKRRVSSYSLRLYIEYPLFLFSLAGVPKSIGDPSRGTTFDRRGYEQISTRSWILFLLTLSSFLFSFFIFPRCSHVWLGRLGPRIERRTRLIFPAISILSRVRFPCGSVNDRSFNSHSLDLSLDDFPFFFFFSFLLTGTTTRDSRRRGRKFGRERSCFLPAG